MSMAERAGIELVPHSWLTHLLTASSLQLIASLPTARFVEFNVSQSALTKGVTIGTPLRLEPDGTVLIPDQPGGGVEVDRDFVRAHRAS
jgi:L-alanine-DL-glutamate epimerase-like enolase superfamily enzyme